MPFKLWCCWDAEEIGDGFLCNYILSIQEMRLNRSLY